MRVYCQKLGIGLGSLLCLAGAGCQTQVMNRQPAMVQNQPASGFNPAWAWLRFGKSEQAAAAVEQPHGDAQIGSAMLPPDIAGQGENTKTDAKKPGLNPTWAKLRLWRSGEPTAQANFRPANGQPRIVTAFVPVNQVPSAGPVNQPLIAAANEPAHRGGDVAVIVPNQMSVVASTSLPALSADNGRSIRPLAIASTRGAVIAPAAEPALPAAVNAVDSAPNLAPVPQNASTPAPAGQADESTVYYIVTDGDGQGEQTYRVPMAGKETVMDAINLIDGVRAIAPRKRIWITRAGGDAGQLLLVDYRAIAERRSVSTNYQLKPGDRIHLKSAFPGAPAGTRPVVAAERFGGQR